MVIEGYGRLDLVEEEVSGLGPQLRVLDQTLPDEVLLALVLQGLDAFLDGLLGHRG